MAEIRQIGVRSLRHFLRHFSATIFSSLSGPFSLPSLGRSVPLVGFPLCQLATVGSLKRDSLAATIFAAEDLGRMIAQERTITPCQKARTKANRRAGGWLSSSSLRKIEVGRSGVLIPRVKSRCRSLELHSEAFLKTSLQHNQSKSCDQKIATTPATPGNRLILSCD